MAFLKSRVDYIYCKFQYVKAVSYAAYTPEDSDTFNAMCQQLCDEVIRTDLLEKRVQVELAISLSLPGIFFDQFLNRIFSLEFLSDLDNELEEYENQGKKRTHTALTYLIRGAAIECPHLSLPRTYPDVPKLRNTGLAHEKLHSILSRICGDSSFIQLVGQAPYGYTIDATLYVQARQILIKPEEAEERLKFGEDIARIAVLCVGRNSFCLNCDHLNGLMSAKIRRLEMLGYSIVLVPVYKLHVKYPEEKRMVARFLAKKLNAAIGNNLFNSFCL